MTTRTNPSTEGALEAVAYLARSENRVRILEALSEEPYDRRDLVDETGVSSATAGRVLKELQSRGWAERTRDGYVATPAGTRVMDEFEPFIGAMETILHLGDAVEWIPRDELSIELRHFDDAAVRRPERYDPAEVTDFFVDLLRDATTFRALTHLVPIEAKETIMLEGLRAERLDVTLVVTGGLFEYLRDHPDHRVRWAALLEAGIDAFRYDDRIPCNLFVLDGTVILADSHSDSGHPYACLVSDDPTVLSWATDLIDRYRVRAERVDGRSLAGEDPVRAERPADEESTSIE